MLVKVFLISLSSRRNHLRSTFINSFLIIGGTSAIFICDDGMQLISAEDREERIAFYANHNIGWVARPGHSSAPGGFKRAGKFKKASK
jgi:hypothetical protein